MSESSLDRFAHEYPQGTVLFTEGDAGDVMYVIQSGEVEIRRKMADGDKTLAVLPPGEFFGEMSLLSGRPRSATAVVRRDARLLRVEPRTFEAMLRGKVEIGLRMITALAARLEKANQQIELLLLASPNHRVVQCLRQLAEAQLQACGVPGTQSAMYLPIVLEDIAARVALPAHDVAEVIERLRSAHLIVAATEAGIGGPGYVIPEVGRLLEFVEFLELKDRFGKV